MEQVLMETAMSQGIWVVLFVSLFIYTIKRCENLEKKYEQREIEYQKIIHELTEKFEILNDIREDLKNLK